MGQLKDRCEQTLISAHCSVMWAEFQTLLNADKVDGMSIYGPCSL
jgi:hypothetical protein